MGRYIFLRIIGLFITLLFLSMLVFGLMHIIPGGPFDVEGGDKGIPLPEAVRQEIMKEYGLDKPLVQQYLDYIGKAARLDFGRSFARPTETVIDLISRTWKVSIQLGLVTFLVALTFGLAMGMISALHQNSWIDYITTTFSVAGTVFPNFVVGVVLVVIFSVLLHWLPTSGWEGPEYWIMPVIAFSLLPMSQIARYTRSSFLEVLSQDYVRTARAKGLSEQGVLLKHVLRNSLIPIVTILGPIIADVFTGSFFIESIFRIPGLGRFFTTSIMVRDYPMIMSTTLLIAVVLSSINLVTDILYVVIDPRVRLNA